jgi:hypothetical protein
VTRQEARKQDNRGYQGETTEKSASLVRASMKYEEKWMQWII